MAQKRKKNKKLLYWGLILVLLIVAGVVTYLVWNNYFRDKKGDDGGDSNTALVEDNKDDEKKSEVADNGDENEREAEKEKITAYEGSNPNKAGSLTGVVTYAGVSPDGEKLVIRVNIDQYLGEGSCELNLVQGGVAYSDTANIVSSASTATCEGFDVPVSRLGNGNYKIVIKMNSGEKTGTINGEVDI